MEIISAPKFRNQTTHWDFNFHQKPASLISQRERETLDLDKVNGRQDLSHNEMG